MSEPALKCENNAIFKQIHTPKLLIAFKMAYYCCFSLGGIQIIQNASKKSFITSTTWKKVYKVEQIGVTLLRRSFAQSCCGMWLRELRGYLKREEN